MPQHGLDPIDPVEAADKDSGDGEVEEGSINVADGKEDKEGASSKSKVEEDNNKFVDIK